MSDIRTPDELERVVAMLDPVGNPRYRKRDITGDGRPETFCNYFCRDALRMLGVHVPPMLVNDLLDWFKEQSDWREVDAGFAAMRASAGFPTVAIVKAKGHGHIALVIPARGIAGVPSVWIAQAGNINFARGPLADGFGVLKPLFYTHD